MWMTMRERGLRASGTQDDFTVPVKAYHLSDAMQLDAGFDIGFLAMKSYDTEWAAHFLKRLVRDDGVVVSSQNCMNDRARRVDSRIRPGRRLHHVQHHCRAVGAWPRDPGRPSGGVVADMSCSGSESSTDGSRPGVEELVDILMCVDDAKATTNLWGERWSKLTTNSSGNPVGAMTGLGAEGVASMPEARRVQINICKESCQVALAQNYQVEPIKGVSAETYAGDRRW